MTAYTHAEARRLLSRTPDTLGALLAGAADAVLDANEGPGTWSPRRVLIHLANAERTNWLPRVRLVLEGAGRPFEPFDRVAGFDDLAAAPVDALLAEFRRERAASLEALDALGVPTADLERTGAHPEFGPVTLGQLLATWVTHDLSHVVQVARTMAVRYREDVGPWAAYLSVLRPRS